MFRKYLMIFSVMMLMLPMILADPGQQSTLFLQSGNLNGQSISASSRTITVAPGEMITGSLSVSYNSAWPTNINIPFGWAPSWGNHQTSYVASGMAQGSGTKTVNVNVQAPTAEGTYYIIMAYRAEIDAGDVFSMTNWARSGGEVWNDGNDIASFSSSQITTANTNGNVVGSVLFDNGYRSLYIPATAIIVEVRSQSQSSDPGATSSLRLVSGTVNGQSVSPNAREIVVSPGQTISGNLHLTYTSTYGSNAAMVFGATPTWGNHQTSYRNYGTVTTPGSGSKSVNLDFVAPTTPGTYHIILAYRAEFTVGQLFSMTNWARSGGEVWNDGNDIADWSTSMINEANANGRTLGSLLTNSGYDPYWVPATALQITVKGPQDGSTSTLSVASGNINGQSVSSSNPSITVNAGQQISGSVTLNYFSSWNSNAVIALGGTPTWGDNAASYRDYGHLSTPGTGSRTLNVDFVAPTSPGKYYLIYSFNGQFNAGQVMSMTSWSRSNGIVWNDGNDIADWSQYQINEARNTGRTWGEILYNDGFKKWIVPATAIEVNVVSSSPPAPEDPGSTSNLLLRDSVINGVTITPQNRVLSVTPGQRIQGSVNLQYTSSWSSDATLPFGYTTSWGSPQSSFRSGGTLTTPTTGLDKSMNIDVTAPTTPGTYWITFAYRAEIDHGDVFSMTNWARSGGEVWNDGNDVASWSSSMIQTANAQGRVLGQVLFNEGYLGRYVPATSIRVDVQQTSGGSCANNVGQLSVECKGGTKTSDTHTGSCRTVTCSSGSGSITGQACDKPGYFEVYQKSKTGSGVDVCFGGTCLNGWGYRRGGNYPICDGGSTSPPTSVCGNSVVQSGEQCDDGNTNSGDGCSSTCQFEQQGAICGNGIVQSGEQCDDGNTASGDGCSSTCQSESSGSTSVNLHIKQWYPQGRNYIFVCDESGYTATSYFWVFGDGHKQTTTSDNVYHTYASPGSYTVQCTASGGGVSKGDTLAITVN